MNGSPIKRSFHKSPPLHVRMCHLIYVKDLYVYSRLILMELKDHDY